MNAARYGAAWLNNIKEAGEPGVTLIRLRCWAGPAGTTSSRRWRSAGSSRLRHQPRGLLRRGADPALRPDRPHPRAGPRLAPHIAPPRPQGAGRCHRTPVGVRSAVRLLSTCGMLTVCCGRPLQETTSSNVDPSHAEVAPRRTSLRLLALLAAPHEPDPPPFMAIGEIDHGLHPYAMDVLLDRLRAASRRT